MIRRYVALSLLAATLTGCGSREKSEASRPLTPAPAPPTAAPDVPKHAATRTPAKARPPAPPRLTAPK